MRKSFQIAWRRSAGNLHVTLNGQFNGRCAWALLKILRQHDRKGRVFVNTNGIQQVSGDGAGLFRLHMTQRQIPRDWLYFKGEKGFKIAPDGSRVLICNRTTQAPEKRSRKPLQSIKVLKQPCRCQEKMDKRR